MSKILRVLMLGAVMFTALCVPSVSAQESAVVFTPPRPAINVLDIGVTARVIADDPDDNRIQLNVRTEASTSAARVTQLVEDALVTILSDAVEAEGYFWREIQTSDGLKGWVVEGFYDAESGRYDRALLPLCPVTTDRIAFFMDSYVYTSNLDGSEACVLDRFRMNHWFTTYLRLGYFPFTFLMSPDGSEFLYVDYPIAEQYNLELYALTTDGAARRNITPGADVAWADWSPDGERILFTQNLEGQENAQLWTMRRNGNALGGLTSNSETRVEWAVWLDNETVLYVENIGDPQSQMGTGPQIFTFYTVNITQGGVKELFRTEDLSIWEPKLSPDKSKMFIQGWELLPLMEGAIVSEMGDSRAILVDIATGEATILESTDEFNFLYASWLPEGADLYISGEGDIPTKIYRLADGTITEYSDLPTIDGLPFLYTLKTLPDGTSILLWGGTDISATTDDQLISLNLFTGELKTLIGGAGE